MADEKGPKYESVSPQAEEEILRFWKEKNIFEKSVNSREGGEDFVFFEGPPTANGKPGVHHVEARSFKDIILRYKTMCGFHVPRRAGWDTHGLPVEVEVEKKLGLKSKKDIENYGVAEFNKKCRESVWEYKELWEKLTDRMGFWIDMKNAYITYDNKYIESLWGIIKKFSDKKLLYEDFKIVPWCARCGTALSSHELAQGYERVKEESIYVKFPLRQKNKRDDSTTSFLVWTTTPWTLPGNVALALNPEIEYVTVEFEKLPGEWLILAEERLKILDGPYNIISRSKGSNFIGTEYEPLYAFEGEKNLYRVVAGEFVSVEEGSGIVHIAPAFGEDDFQVSKINNFPILSTTGEDGLMKALGKKWDKLWFKKADLLIIEDLLDRSLIFKKEIYEHDYPFCWRCKNPLMYFARKTWWVDVNAKREKLLENNQTINWYPEHIKNGRFGEWLKEKKNWAFSRERYWGTPLPVWKCQKCENYKAVGSLEELDELDLRPTNFILMRHGEARHNVERLTMIDPKEDSEDKLTEAGIDAINAAAEKLKKEKIDVIISSPSHRTKETAEIIKDKLGLPDFETDEDLYEILVMGFAGKPLAEYKESFVNEEERFIKKPLGVENLRELRVRVMRAAKRIRKKYAGKNILIISHGDPARVMELSIKGLPESEFKNIPELRTAEFRKIKFHNWPFGQEGELDLHKPYIDEIKLKCSLPAGGCGGEMGRVSEVIDVWFDSGSMPFASVHWPFFGSPTSKGKSDFQYPADYIVEAVDQTRGWFYNLLAVGTLLDKKAPYKNVISLGHVLDEKGKKMSKSLGNIVDPMELMEKYGADAVRWYFYSINQPWDAKLFKELDVRDAHRRFLMILWNSFLYWKTYKVDSKVKTQKLIINKWLVAKWNSVLENVTKNLDQYDIVSAARELENFVIEDLSHWYIRRIREYMKDVDSPQAKESSATLGFVLGELSKTLAPFVPYISEGIYCEIKKDRESVHLEDFPKFKKPDEKDSKIIKEMEKVGEIVTKALEARQKAGIKIRQPLNELRIRNYELGREFSELIMGEVNVRNIKSAKDLKEDIELDTNLTDELKEEGLVREFVRQVQDFRKELKLTPQEKVELFAKGAKELEKILKNQASLIKKEVNISKLDLGELEGKIKEISLDDQKLEIGINHIHHLEIKE